MGIVDKLFNIFANSDFFEHKIAPGDTFGALAKRFDLSVEDIVDANPDVDPRKLQIGFKIRIPKNKKSVVDEVINTGLSSLKVSTKEDLNQLIEDVASRTGVPSQILRGVISVESGGYAFARSESGAHGLMQLMPATIKQLGISDPSDVHQGVLGGAKWLQKAYQEARQLNNKHNFSGFGYDVLWELALMIYHAGSPAVQKWLDAGAPMETNMTSHDLGGFGVRTLQYPQKVISAMNDADPFKNFKAKYV